MPSDPKIDPTGRSLLGPVLALPFAMNTMLSIHVWMRWTDEWLEGLISGSDKGQNSQGNEHPSESVENGQKETADDNGSSDNYDLWETLEVSSNVGDFLDFLEDDMGLW